MPLTLHLFTWRAGAMGSRLPTWVTGQAPGPALPRLRWGSAPSPMGATLTTPFPGQAFVISFTSDFIPRLVYLYMYSENGTMHGFVNHTLSSFNVSDFQNGTAPNDPLDLGYEVQICRYRPATFFFFYIYLTASGFGCTM